MPKLLDQLLTHTVQIQMVPEVADRRSRVLGRGEDRALATRPLAARPWFVGRLLPAFQRRAFELSPVAQDRTLAAIGPALVESDSRRGRLLDAVAPGAL